MAPLLLSMPMMVSSLPPPPDLSTEPESTEARRTTELPWLPREGQWIGGTYRLEKVVGEGGLGIVFSARDVTLDRSVAVKVLRPEMAVRPELRGALIQEARRLAGVKHPHIVTVHACGTHRGYPYVVMELVEGTNALARLRDFDGGLRQDDALRILGALAEGLAALHALGIVHGDVKPSNVLLGRGDRVKLTDIGLSVGPEQSGLRGTMAYLAPERILGDEAGTASDIYAFGVTAFQLLTGSLPFASPASGGHRDAAVLEHPRSARAIRPELPARLELVLAALLSKDPLARPATVSTAMAEIRRAMSQSGTRPAIRPSNQIRRLLVADDDPDLLQMLSVAVATSLRGCAVEGVGTGDDALRSAQHRLPDAIVLDLQMPGRSTPEITRALRALPGGDAIPIVVVTGTGSASDWREVKAAGADGCLLKPFDIQELLANLERYAAQHQSA